MLPISNRSLPLSHIEELGRLCDHVAHARRGAADSGEYRQASRLATLKPRQRRGDSRSEKKTGAIQVGQAHTVGWSAGHNGLKRVRTGAGAECFSLAEETPHSVRRMRTAEKTRRRLQSGDQTDSRSKVERPMGHRPIGADHGANATVSLSQHGESRPRSRSCRN
jgi:hypothetical protein